MPIPALLAPLLAQGLSLIGNAVMAKGKDWVEEKTGVKIEPNMSDKDLLTLKQYEMDHEEELLRLRIEDNKLDLETFREEVKDRGSARDRDIEFIKRGMTNNRANFMFFLAVVMVGILVWIVWKDQNINEYVKGIFTLVLGRFLGYLDNIYSFEFGTTRGSKEKDETIKQLTNGGSK
jgi:hypothetical protein